MFATPPHRAPVQRHCHRQWALLLVLGSALVGLNSHAQPALTLDQALTAAQERSRQLLAQDRAAAAARDMAVAARQLPDPTVKAGINNLPINGADRFSLTRDFMTMRSIGVMQEITRIDKRRSRAARFEREADVADAGRGAALANLQRDTAIAWLERYYHERMHEVLLAQRVETVLQIEAADAAYRGGRGMQADVFAARSAVAQLDDRIRQTEAQIARAMTGLVRWIGDAGHQTLGAPPSMGVFPLDADRLDAQLVHHPQIEMMVAQEAMARAEADMALSNKRSDWSLELMHSRRGPGYSDMVSLNVSVPLQWDQQNRQDREVSAKLALADQMRFEREETLREHLAEARGWLQEWQSLRNRLAHYDSALIPLTAGRAGAALAAYRGGNGPLGAVLEARRMEIDTRMDRLRLEMQTAELWARLNYLVPAAREAVPPVRPMATTEK